MQTDIAALPAALQTGFYPMAGGANFLLAYGTADSAHAIVFVPPFAEEMNKCRHLISATMRQLSAAGYSCFLLDNYGTGDSEGDLDNAAMALWRDDLHQLLGTITAQGYCSVSFVAIRFGTLQLFDLLNHYTLPVPVKRVVLWQPIFDMAKFWQQFVRIKVAEAMASGNKLSQKQVEQQLQNGENIEIAGYPISPAFFHSLWTAKLNYPQQLQHCHLCWLETSQLETIAMPVEKIRQQLTAQCQLTFHQLKDEPYWQTAELASANQLQALTLAYLTQDRTA